MLSTRVAWYESSTYESGLVRLQRRQTQLLTDLARTQTSLAFFLNNLMNVRVLGKVRNEEVKSSSTKKGLV